MRGGCELCGEWVEDILLHIEIAHPDHYEPIETWPDGKPVIIDTTIEPKDFT